MNVFGCFVHRPSPILIPLVRRMRPAGWRGGFPILPTQALPELRFAREGRRVAAPFRAGLAPMGICVGKAGEFLILQLKFTSRLPQSEGRAGFTTLNLAYAPLG